MQNCLKFIKCCRKQYIIVAAQGNLMARVVYEANVHDGKGTPERPLKTCHMIPTTHQNISRWRIPRKIGRLDT